MAVASHRARFGVSQRGLHRVVQAIDNQRLRFALGRGEQDRDVFWRRERHVNAHHMRVSGRLNQRRAGHRVKTSSQAFDMFGLHGTICRQFQQGRP